jgi:hypothetical protein
MEKKFIFDPKNSGECPINFQFASFPAGSSGDPFSLVEKFLKDLVSDAQLGKILLKSLAYFCSSFASGIFPLALAPYYGSARLIPLVKKDGRIRPMPLAKYFAD